jgi:hypothetical protein
MRSKTQKQAVKKQVTKKQAHTEKISYPSNRNLWLLTLAPGVTFEDSGELIAAAYGFGVPHEPGYPLFTILGKIFSYIPIGNIAYRLNMMSAFLTSCAALFLCYATVLMIEELFIRSKFWKTQNESTVNFIKYAIALTTAILFGISSENWEQSVITEVYGLNNFFTGLFILLALLWKRQETQAGRTRYFLFISLILGLTITNHSTSIMLIPIFGMLILLVDRKALVNFRLLLKSLGFFILGLTPFLYLPLASSRNPIMDWGNPENFTNFVRTITRSQYQLDEHQTGPKFIAELSFYFSKLLSEQWIPVLLILAVIGLVILYRNNKKLFWFGIVFLLFSIPITTYMTDFDVRGNTFASKENGELVSVFYIPSYMFISLLMGVGLFFLISLIKVPRKFYYVLSTVVVILAIFCCSFKYKKNDMSKYKYPEEYTNNLFKIAGKDAVIFYNWDPFGFPFYYYQYVEKKRTDVIVIDQMLLKRSWYIDCLKNHYSKEIYNPSKVYFENFLKAVAPFEAKKPYDGGFIEYNYINMINAIIDTAIGSGKDVFFTYIPQQNILRDYKIEPVFAAYRITKKPPFISNVKFEDFNFSNFTNNKLTSDRMADYVRSYYADLIIGRATLFENVTIYQEALNLYNKALLFTKDNKNLTTRLQTKINELKLRGIN